MGVLKFNGTVVNLDAVTQISDTNANGFGPEVTNNPDLVNGVLASQFGMDWSRGYFQNQDIRTTSYSLPHIKLGRSGFLPMGNGPVPGVTLRQGPSPAR